MTELKVLKQIAFVCPICQKKYDKKEHAEECLSKGLPGSNLKIGDFVFGNYVMGWWSGEDHWIPASERRGHKKGEVGLTLHPYYVVVDIQKTSHARTGWSSRSDRSLTPRPEAVTASSRSGIRTTNRGRTSLPE